MKKKYWYYLAGTLCLVLAVVIFLNTVPPTPQTQSEQYGPQSSTPTTPSSSHQKDTSVGIDMPTNDPQAPQQGNQEDNPQTPGYTSKVDFEMLQQLNPDIYAWIQIPGTDISYPIVQSATDDELYLDHNSDGNSDVRGAIFSEHRYNDTTFDDAVTVLYGHNMKDGSMFGDLQPIYRISENLNNYNEIVVYLPHKEIHFEIFAAMQYSRMHLLYYYQMEKEASFNLFIDNVYSTRNLNMTLVEELRPEFGDQVVVLSTCLSGNNNYRYLVMGVCKEVD